MNLILTLQLLSTCISSSRVMNELPRYRDPVALRMRSKASVMRYYTFIGQKFLRGVKKTALLPRFKHKPQYETCARMCKR